MSDFDQTVVDANPGGTEPHGIEIPVRDYPRVEVHEGTRAIDRLKPGSDLHAKVLQYLIKRLDLSERQMERFYNRWNTREQQLQAYVDLADWEKDLQSDNESGKPPKIITIQIPYSFSTLTTITTYINQALFSRNPLFPVGTYKGETAWSALNVQTMLQFNADHTRMYKELFKFSHNCQAYGVGILLTAWQDKISMRSTPRVVPKFSVFGRDFGSSAVEQDREPKLVYSGNIVESLDPYHFFPDPRVPMVDVNQKGEFVFWRTYSGIHELKSGEAAGDYKWVDDIKKTLPRNGSSQRPSIRHLLSGGNTIGSEDSRDRGGMRRDLYQLDQGTIDLIPRELGIGENDTPEKWIFTFANRNQIVQAEMYDADHDKHPVAVAEPYSLGEDFGSPALTDYIGPIQDTLGWFFNSHYDNVRRTMNNEFVVDPSMIEMQDLKKPHAGLLIRLKRTAMGQDVRTAITQFPVTDVTRNHIQDAQILFDLGARISGASDNLQGLQEAGGRKTATEVRGAAQSGASRLMMQARIISSQASVDQREQMTLNLQQYLDPEFSLTVLGKDLEKGPIRQIGPMDMVGDFYYPVHDGSIQMDRIALLDAWKELFLALLSDEELRATYSVGQAFEFIAELGGIDNIDQFKIVQGDGGDLAQQAQQGNIVPIRGQRAARGGGPSDVRSGGIPADRIRGALS